MFSRCLLEDGLSSLKLLVRTSSLSFFKELDGGVFYVRLCAVPARGGPGVVQFLQSPSELISKSPIEDELCRFRERLEAEMVESRAASTGFRV